MPAPVVQVRYGNAVGGVTSQAVPPTIRGRIPTSISCLCCSLLHPCWRAFPLSLHHVYCCTSQGAGMSLAQRVIFVLMWSSPRESCSVMAELQSQELLGGMSTMPLSLFSLFCSYFWLCLRLFFPLVMLHGSTVLLLAGKWLSVWSNVNRRASWCP